jgi:chromosome segregation ATPase
MMLHLAQVQQHDQTAQTELKLLAAQEVGDAWTILSGEVLLPPDQANKFKPSQLVLADLSENREVLAIHDAKDWVVEVIQHHLSNSGVPKLFQEEVQRAEQWRQSLTLQSQELDRRALEMEARREQIQELEENLKQERRDLERQREQLNQAEQNLDREKQSLAAQRQALEIDQSADRASL